jgi:hypothetical protein
MLSIQKSILFLALVSVVQVSAAQTSGSEDIRPADEQAIFQMTPADVLRLRGAAANHEQAQYREIINPEITAQLVEITLDPEEKIHSIYLLQRAPTSLNFVDVSGTPWPVVTIKGYDGELFGVEAIENEFNNAIVLHGVLPAGMSFISVFLKGLPHPVTVRVVVGVDQYNSNQTFKIMRIGPETELNIDTISAASQIGLPSDVDLNNVMYAVTPTGAKKIKVNQPDVQVWEKDGDILVRTNLTIFSPAHLRLKTGPNGYNAYRLPNTTRIYASTDAGNVINIVLENLQ